MRAAYGLSGDCAEVKGEAFAQFVVPAKLLLQLAAAQRDVGGVSAIHFETEIKLGSELVSEGSAAGEDRTSRLDADGARDVFPANVAPAFRRRTFFGESVFWKMLLR